MHALDCRHRLTVSLREGETKRGGLQVHLVGHSAGGWLGRSFLADPLYFDSPAAEPGVPHQGVASLVTLGTPHSAPRPEQARDMTGGALTWVNSQWPGGPAYLLSTPQTACLQTDVKRLVQSLAGAPDVSSQDSV